MEEAVVDLYLKGQIDASIFQKCLVKLAHEWAVAENMDQAHRLLASCDPDYFHDIQPQQMEEDEEYCSQAFELAIILVNRGIVQTGVFSYGPRGEA